MLPESYTWSSCFEVAMDFMGEDLIRGFTIAILGIAIAGVVLGTLMHRVGR